MKTSALSKNKIKTALYKLITLIFWIVLWYALFKVVDNSFLLSSPEDVLRRVYKLIITGEFWITTGISILRISLGYILGISAGVLIAILTASNEFINELFKPLLTIIKTTPVASFILLLLVWLRKDNIPTTISFLMVLPISWANVSTGIENVDNKLIEVSKIYNFSFINIIKNIYIPSVKPHFLSACTTALGLSWKAGVAAGVLSQPKHSIGAQLYSSKIYLDTENLFAWTLVVIIISLILEKIVKSLINKVRG